MLQVDAAGVLAAFEQEAGDAEAVKLRRALPDEDSSVRHQFSQQWTHPMEEPTVHAVYGVVVTPKMKSKFSKRQQAVANKMKERGDTFKATAEVGKGNTKRRFHGTSRSCLVGEESLVPCTDPNCATCSIVRNGFQLGQGEELRFGKGIYSTSASSKASTYAKCAKHRKPGGPGNCSETCGRRAMFVVSAVAGNVDKRFES